MPERSVALRDVFDEALPYASYVESLPAGLPGREDFGRPLDLAGAELAFREVRDLRVLAIVEEWCKDSRDALPVIAALLRSSPDSELRVVERDDHPDLMGAYLKDERFASIPVILLLDREFGELDRYVERPVAVTRLRRAEREGLAEADPRFLPVDAKPSQFEEPVSSDLRQAILDARRRSQPAATVLIAAELAAVADRIRARQAGLAPARIDQPRSISGLSSMPALQIVDVGDDDCEVPA